MFKKILFLSFLLFFQNSYLYSREFNYKVYGLNINFLKIKFHISNNKLYAVINSRGLTDYFIKSKNIIQTTLDRKNNSLNYYFNSQSKGKEKTYFFKKINNRVKIENIKLNKGEDFKKIKKRDLFNIFDPLSATGSLLFSNTLNSKCNGSKKIYDGDDVYLIYLTKNKIKKSYIKFKNTKFIINFSCKLNYKAISGHKLKREKKLNSMYLDVYFSKIVNDIVPVYFETRAKLVPLKMYLSTNLTP